MFNHNEDDINELSASDVYIITSPNETHVEWIEAIRSFGQDKYIFCEKPPATSHEDLQKIKEYVVTLPP